MDLKDIKKLEWKSIYDWSLLPRTGKGKFRQRLITEGDINNFITFIIKNLARSLIIDYKELETLIKDENAAFYSIMEDTFQNNTEIKISDDNLKLLQGIFKIPIVPSYRSDPVNTLLTNFERLSDVQKVAVLTKLSLFSIKIVDNNTTKNLENLL